MKLFLILFGGFILLVAIVSRFFKVSKDEPLRPGEGYHCGPVEDYENEFYQNN